MTTWKRPRLARALAALACAVLLLDAPGTIAQDGEEALEFAFPDGAGEGPRRHMRLRWAADLTPERAAEIYDIVAGALARGYGRADVPGAGEYSGWTRYNTAPYRSATHGAHYVNNYANDIAKAYGQFEEAGRLPVGSLVAKDSFAVTETGEIVLGPLFLMEKMPDGFNYASGDWKYIQVQPDGSLFGETNGTHSDRVSHCIACHLVRERQDHLYFIPEELRVTASE